MLPVTSIEFISVWLCCIISLLALDLALTILDNPSTKKDYHVMGVNYNIIITVTLICNGK